ncbi:unnamed protein product [Staurois parvus]|uniref:Uncharacterized protein n=1 Tax=Staurois parvus TaxID=386267 RepID=A0ABN9HJ85_9NEOB|nr:unnamed protein product [Staurois parvus]
MTRDCGQCRDDQRLWTVQEMTADLWGGGERVPEFDRYPLLLPQSFFYLTCSLYPAARCLPGFCSVGRSSDSRMPSCACARSAALCDWSGGF